MRSLANSVGSPGVAAAPVDTLARAAKRSDNWLEFLKTELLATKHVKECGIFDVRNCARW
jgi:hypothetical protein